ncbi:axin1 [Pungitius sinensis]
MDAGTMSAGDSGDYLADLGGSFTEDAPRPPVPGEEGELVCGDGRQYGSPGFSSKSEAPVATPRRPDLDLGYEPEGSASPTPPYVKWAESLHSLLDDQEGIHLFRVFLKQEACGDVLDFWFACSGFRKLEAIEGGSEEKKVKLAKAIYKKYILDNNGIVSRQIKPATKSFIKDCVAKLHIDPAMFDQAQTEIQATMEENTYPLFLKSDIYLEYTRAGGESPKLHSDQSSVSGNGKGLSNYLPTLIEDEEWRCEQEPEEQPDCDPTPSSRLTQKLLMEAAPQRVASSSGSRFQDCPEFRLAPCREPINPYYVNAGYAVAPAASANDSEQQSMSSDADTISLTDSSVDGVPPYRHRKRHRREMHESAKANGQVPLPHIPRTDRIPKDIHVEPERFAAELMVRLEAVLREREAQEQLEERLKRVRLEEEGDEVVSGAYPQNHNPRYADSPFSGAAARDAHEENPESILDDHVRRVMKTPGCQSPGAGRLSPKSRSPDGVPAPGRHPSRHGLKGDAGHPHHHHRHAHHVHHGAVGKPKEQAEAQGGFPGSAETGHCGSKSRSYADGAGSNPVEHAAYSSKGGAQCKRAPKKGEEARLRDAPAPVEEMEKNQKILLWLMEGQKELVQHKRSPYGSAGGSRRPSGHEAQPWSAVQPSHPFVQDPTMPPNPAPSPLIQLEEVRRRLEEETITSGAVQPKQRYVMEVIQRGRSALRPALFPPLGAVCDGELSQAEHRATKKQPCENITVAYYFCEELIPYLTSVRGRVVTLGQFKELLTKKGSYRYYFKKVSDEFDCGVVFEEVREDDAVLPIYEEKIIGKVEKID